jgi:hypothetical protein
MKKFTAVFFLIFVILAACSMPPKEEMNKAQDTVLRAENDADAVGYAGNTLIRARDALTRMQNEADAKRYDAAKNYAAEAIALAERAETEGKTGAARAREEASALLSGLSGSLAETTTSLSAARNVENMVLDFNALSNELDSARRGYGEAEQSLQANDFRDAAAKGQNVRSQLADINAALTGAGIATSRKQ